MAIMTVDGRMTSTKKTTTIGGDTRLKTNTNCNRQATIRNVENRSIREGLQPSPKSSTFRALWLLLTY